MNLARFLVLSLQDDGGRPVISFSAALTIESDDCAYLVRDDGDAACGFGPTPTEALVDWLRGRLASCDAAADGRVRGPDGQE